MTTCEMTEERAQAVIKKIKDLLLSCGAHFTIAEAYKGETKFLTINDVSIKIK
jgi:hypothetical protein